MRKIQICVLPLIFILICCADTYAFLSTKTTLVINNVVAETEDPYIETSEGTFALPDFTNVVNMDTKSLNKLVLILEANVGKEVNLYFYDKIVVGIEAYDKKLFMPKYEENKKIKYNDKPFKISTTMHYWENYTDKLFIVTNNGTYCIYHDYKYEDYYNKVYIKLFSKIEMNKKKALKLDIYFHKLSGNEECTGAIEDIRI
jgi:hypothetical protein